MCVEERGLAKGRGSHLAFVVVTRGFAIGPIETTECHAFAGKGKSRGTIHATFYGGLFCCVRWEKGKRWRWVEDKLNLHGLDNEQLSFGMLQRHRN